MNFEKLNETNCRMSDIQNDDKILIGGSFPGRLDLAVKADINQFKDFFEIVQKYTKNIQNNQSMQNWLKQNSSDFDIRIFSHLLAFDNVLRKIYPKLSDHIEQRSNFYDTEGSKTLSQAVENGVCQCAEIAILAQAYLQKQDIQSQYFGGEMFRSLEDEFAEAHSFIMLKVLENDYIYDPVNSIFKNSMYLPRISSIEATPEQKKQFEKKIHIEGDKRNCAFLEAKNILTKSSWFYGCGDGGSLFPSFIISKNNFNFLISKERNM